MSDLSWFTPSEPEVHIKGDEKGRSYTPDACELIPKRKPFVAVDATARAR